MIVVVKLALAVICFSGECHPALVGKETPTGSYGLQQRYVASPGYGGDVLAFRETEDAIFAVHRVWTLRPEQRRLERLASPDPAQRQTVTDGCINVAPEVYAKLVECCAGGQLEIEP